MRRGKVNYWLEIAEKATLPSRADLSLHPIFLMLSLALLSATIFLLSLHYLIIMFILLLIFDFLLIGKKELLVNLLAMTPFLIVYIVAALFMQYILGFSETFLILLNVLRMASLGILGLTILSLMDISRFTMYLIRISPKLAILFTIALKSLYFSMRSLHEVYTLYTVNYYYNSSFRKRIELTIILSRALINIIMNKMIEMTEALYTRQWLFQKGRNK